MCAAQPTDWSDWSAANACFQAYADALDRADLPAFLALFTKDAIWDHGPTHVCQGHEAIGAFLKPRLARYQATSHHIGPPTITARDDGALDAVAYLIATHVLTDGTSYTGYGRYLTTFVRVRDGMLIQRHQVVAHVTHGAAQPVNQLVRRGAAAPHA